MTLDEKKEQLDYLDLQLLTTNQQRDTLRQKAHDLTAERDILAAEIAAMESQDTAEGQVIRVQRLEGVPSFGGN